MTGAEAARTVPQEQLIAIFRPKRVSSLFNYVFGAVFIAIGLLFMISSSAGFVAYSFIAWSLGLSAIILGSGLMIWTEVVRRSKLYIITDWNVRVRKGYLNKTTRRVFYDEIDHVSVHTDAQDEIADQGDIEIYVQNEDDPALQLTAVENPKGVREIIIRFRETSEEPVPWKHIDKTRIAPY